MREIPLFEVDRYVHRLNHAAIPIALRRAEKLIREKATRDTYTVEYIETEGKLATINLGNVRIRLLPGERHEFIKNKSICTVYFRIGVVNVVVSSDPCAVYPNSRLVYASLVFHDTFAHSSFPVLTIHMAHPKGILNRIQVNKIDPRCLEKLSLDKEDWRKAAGKIISYVKEGGMELFQSGGVR